ncbi:hypothetical protein E2C01_035634 [Portunus trituberculatus]|uniref:Uncharacterized protein n=1 Tax=Portunus trituberculatus TaxID=210409 RepID=A0A5B7FAA5_PORTR|nr:hypothetical protein [Portunus trituberculatus]
MHLGRYQVNPWYWRKNNTSIVNTFPPPETPMVGVVPGTTKYFSKPSGVSLHLKPSRIN